MHDPRVGRFFAVDPLTKDYPEYAPYSFSGNKVIAWGELEGLEEVLVIRDQISPGVFDLYYIWDVTARERGEGRQIQYYDVQSGTFSVMRSTTLEERKNSFIRNAVTAEGSQKSIDATNDSGIATNQFGIQRIDANGDLVNYQQTKVQVDKTNGRVGVLGESRKTFNDDVQYRGITAVSYSMPGFRAASDAQKINMTQPSNALQANLTTIAQDYLNGDAIQIRIQITTNNPATMPNIQQSNDMRANAIINFLVNQGVDPQSIVRQPDLFNQPTWDAQITVDEAQP